VGSPPRVGLTPSDCRQSGTSIMSSHMPPVPPANRSKEPGSDPKTSTDTSIKQDEKHHNAAEEGDTANIEQNKTNKGFFRGRREGWSVYAANGCPARSAAGPCARSSSTRSRRRMLDCGGPRTLTPSSTGCTIPSNRSAFAPLWPGGHSIIAAGSRFFARRGSSVRQRRHSTADPRHRQFVGAKSAPNIPFTAVGDSQDLGFERLQRDLLRQHTVARS
jgi:hypothetical protein